MPPKGWKSITVPQETYDYFFRKWKKDKEKYRLECGITSFTGFVSKMLNQVLKEREKKMK